MDRTVWHIWMITVTAKLNLSAVKIMKVTRVAMMMRAVVMTRRPMHQSPMKRNMDTWWVKLFHGGSVLRLLSSFK